MEVHVYQIGSRVLLGEEIKGLISGVCIRSNGYITYEITWWNGNDRKVEWVQVDEISPIEPKSQRIGFK